MKDLIGQHVEYDGRPGEVVAMKRGPMMLDGNSKIGAATIRSSYQLRVKPDDGGACFWTPPCVDNREQGS